jgi:hypothetical protein
MNGVILNQDIALICDLKGGYDKDDILFLIELSKELR